MSTCKVIGIDLGTTFSCVGVYKNGRVEVIANDEGSRTTPSEVAFTKDERLVGQSAKDQGHRNPKNTVYNVKRLIGRKYFEPEVQKDIKTFLYNVENKSSKPVVEVEFKGEQKQFTPEEISATILLKMKSTAEKFLDHEVTDAVITVPAYFNDGQRQATKDAATIAGLNAVRIINEPTAAAMAYGLANNIVGEKNVFIFDLGGGTFDVSIVRVSEGPKFEVKATTGDTHLGGIDFDQRLFYHFADEFKTKFAKDVTKDSRASRKLMKACERAKIRLSTAFEVTVEVESLMDGIDFDSSIKRARFEDLCSSLFDATIEKSERALLDANLKKSDIDDVVLVGGSTRIPKIQNIVEQFFDDKDLKHSINVDEAVAYGAAVQAAVLSNIADTTIKEVTLHDVAPLSLGLQTGYENMMSVVIPRNKCVPTTASKTFTNNGDNQKSVVFEVFEGERPLTKDNHKLGEFSLNDIPQVPAETLMFDVTFSIDANGILSVSAVEKSTGKSNSVTIKDKKGRLSKEEIDRMIEDAKRFEKEDKVQREKTAARGEIESYAHSVKNALENRKNRLSNEEATKARKAWNEALDWLDSNKNADISQIVLKCKSLKNSCDSLMAKMK